MTYDYHFNNETISIDIPDSDYEVLIKLDRLERNVNQKETRRHVSLEALNLDEDLLPSDSDVEGSFISHLEEEALRRAMDRLLPDQRILIHKVFYENQTITSLAYEESVSKAAICRRLNRALDRLKNSFEFDR